MQGLGRPGGRKGENRTGWVGRRGLPGQPGFTWPGDAALPRLPQRPLRQTPASQFLPQGCTSSRQGEASSLDPQPQCPLCHFLTGVLFLF